MRARKRGVIATLAGACSGVIAGQAAATTVTSLVLSPDQPSAAAIAEDPSLRNRTTFDLIITTTGGDWTNSTLKFTLTDGTFYNASDGGDVPTNVGSWSSSGFMHLRHDTFVARPPDFLTPPLVAGRHPVDGAGAAIFAPTNTSVSWLDTSSAYPPGTYTIARLTVSNDAVGSFFGNSFDSSLPGTPQPYDDAINKQLRWDIDPISVNAQGGSGTWDSSTSNFWNGNFNVAWNDARNDVAIFDDGSGVVTVASTVSASALRFESPGYTLTGGAITLVGFARITTDESAVIDSAVVSGVGLIKDGPATLTINGSISAVSGDWQVNAGHLNVNDLQTTGNVTVAGGAGLTANHVRASALSIEAVATVDTRADGTFAHTSVVSDLAIDGGTVPTGKLDLRNNALVIDHSGSSPISTIAAQIAAAFNGGAWDGNGITSSLANNSTHGVGFAERADLSSVPAIFGSVDGTAVLARYTRFGDADLNGVVNLDDFNRLAANFGMSNRFWHHGDFTYNGIVNLDDFNKLAANFGLAVGPEGPGPEDWAALAALVPEPSAGAAVLVTALLLPRDRRRRTRLSSATYHF